MKVKVNVACVAKYHNENDDIVRTSIFINSLNGKKTRGLHSEEDWIDLQFDFLPQWEAILDMYKGLAKKFDAELRVLGDSVLLVKCKDGGYLTEQITAQDWGEYL